MMGGARACKNMKQVALRATSSVFLHISIPHHGFTSRKLDFTYCVVKYSNLAYFLGHALVNAHSLRANTVMYSTKIYRHYV